MYKTRTSRIFTICDFAYAFVKAERRGGGKKVMKWHLIWNKPLFQYLAGNKEKEGVVPVRRRGRSFRVPQKYTYFPATGKGFGVPPPSRLLADRANIYIHIGLQYVSIRKASTLAVSGKGKRRLIVVGWRRRKMLSIFHRINHLLLRAHSDAR